MGTWGIQDFKHINKALTCWIQQEGEVVIGAIGEGTSLEISANWESPFKDSSLESMYAKTGGAVQHLSGGQNIYIDPGKYPGVERK